METQKRVNGLHKNLGTIAICLVAAFASGCNGSAKDLAKGSSLGPPVIGDGGSRSDGNDFGQIYTVTKVVEGDTDIPEWTNAELPFTGPRRQLGQNFTDSQWPFKFTYSYPTNNYKLSDARLVIVTRRDSSDTEAIFIDGVMTGRPPAANVSTSAKTTHRHYVCVGGTCSGAAAPVAPANTYFMDFSLSHYKVGMLNSFDLNLVDLLAPTTLKPVDIVNDGVLRVVTGDDAYVDGGSTVEKPLLFLEGFTVSKTALSCTTSPTYDFANTYVHNDGNSIGANAFTGTVVTASASWGAANSAFRSVEFFYDPKLPRISDVNRLNLSKAEIAIQVKRAATGTAAIVINGIGISQVGFDRSQAGAGVESWEESSSAVSAWETFVTGIPADETAQTRTLNLISLLGANKVRELLAQGKLNVSIAGSLATVYGAAATSTRTYGVAVNGPDLVLEGNYNTELCEVPDNPSSPLSDSSGSVGSCELDQASPVASSIQVVSITSTSARIQWLTSEPSDSQIGYGLTSPTTNTPLDSTLTSFHAVQLTGLQPYKYYQFVVKTRDGCGNQTISGASSFRTLR